MMADYTNNQMDSQTEQPALMRLRKLLGADRFDEERRKGKEIRERAPENKQADMEVRNEPLFKQTLEAASSLTAESLAELNLNTGGSLSKGAVASGGQFERLRSPYSATVGSESDDETIPFGREAEPGEVFCPIMAVSKYPYRHLDKDKELMEIVAAACFNNGRFWQRKWTIFCLPVPQEYSEKPLFLVTLKEVESLFADIHTRVNKNFQIPSNSNGGNFRISFDANEPKAILLGVSRSREQFDSVSDRAMKGDFLKLTRASEKVSTNTSKEFHEKVEKAVQAARNRKGKSKAKTAQQKVPAMQKWCEQLHHAQSYLGLRAEAEIDAERGSDHLVARPNSMALDKTEFARPSMPPELDISQPPTFRLLMDAVIVSIDLEVQERNHKIITEIGVATLDTRDIASVGPGSAAVNWRGLAKYRHYRVEEFSSHRNEYVRSCPERFEKKFGTSEFIRSKDIAKVLALSCKAPFHTEMSDLILRDGQSVDIKKSDEQPEFRNIVLVGHAIESDIGFLKLIGIDIRSWSGVVGIIDTVAMQRAVTREPTALSLGSLLHLYGIDAWNLHNAGNDAAYTLQAFMAIAVEHLANPENRKTEEEEARRYEEIQKKAPPMLSSHPSSWIALGS